MSAPDERAARRERTRDEAAATPAADAPRAPEAPPGPAVGGTAAVPPADPTTAAESGPAAAPAPPPVDRDARPARAPAEPPPPSRPPRRRGARALRALGVLVVLVGLAAGAAALWVLDRLEPVDPGAEAAVEFEVLPGQGATSVAYALEDAGLARSGRVFGLYLRARDLDRAVGEGLYDLSPSMDASELAEALAAGGRPRTAVAVVPEGWRADAVVARLAEAGWGERGELEALVEEPGDLRPPYLPLDASLEGYLFPATYELPVHATAEDAIRAMLERFDEELTPEAAAAVAEAGLTVHDWVILASIVQAEAGGDDEMGIIAGVFRNRLDRGMPLQSDPTAAYGLGIALPEMRAADLREDHPWNTYTRAGLPAGPISNPGAAALRAVLEPVRASPDGEPWLYFLHGVDDGEPVFRPNTSLAAHERDVDRYLR